MRLLVTVDGDGDVKKPAKAVYAFGRDAAKRVCERIVQALAEEHPESVFSMVRFGNVLGSSGLR